MDLITSRRSVRKYSPKAVETEKLDLCIEAARLAPSASNVQPWRLILVDDLELKDSVAKATVGPGSSFNRFAVQAPVIVVVVIEPSTALNRIGAAIKKRDFPLIDIGIAAEHLCLQAAELGLGTCMMGWFDERTIKRLLGIPASKRIGLVISLGYPDEADSSRPKIRKPVEAILGRNRY
ncbi:MAG: nitroreductase family protein [Rectinemataceae bacterium]|jgi:nitroreductase